MININPHDVNYFNTNLKYLLKKFGIKQDQLALQVNKKQTTISNWINKIGGPDANDLIVLRAFFGISIDTLLLVDLNNSKIVTEEHLQEFKLNGKVNGNILGKVLPLSKGYFTPDDQLKTVINEPDATGSWAIMGQLKLMDGKLDELRALAEKTAKK